MSISYQISEAKDLEICRVLAAWDKFEAKVGGPAVIDFDLLGICDDFNETTYTARAEVLSDLVSLENDSEVASNPTLNAKIRAQSAYLRNLMGEHWEFKDYIKSTVGFTSRSFTEQELVSQRSEMKEALSRIGVHDDENLEKNLESADTDIPESEIGEFYSNIAQSNKEELEPIIGPIPDFSFSVEFEDVDAYWSNWVDGSKMDYRLRFNRRNVKKHSSGHSTLLAFHEISAHLVQAAILNRRIGMGLVPRCMGLTTVHDPSIFQCEGIAQSLTYFLDTEYSRNPFLIAKRETLQYKLMIENNLHIMINSRSGIEDCVKYGRSHMPFKSANEIAHSLSSKVNNSQFRCYEHVYGASAFLFKKIALQSDAEQKNHFLNRTYNEWLSASPIPESETRF